MKFKNGVLTEWSYSSYHSVNGTTDGWYRSIGDNSTIGYVYLYETNQENVWEIKFWYSLESLGDVFNCRFIIGTLDEAKIRIDTFLTKINNLRAFI
jgi:hypothetical protein